MLLPLFRRHFRARQAVAWLSAPWVVPAGSKGRADGCIAKGNRCREASREKLRPPASVAVPGSCLTHGRWCWRSSGAPGCWPAGAGGAGLVARVVWERGGCLHGLWAHQHDPGPALVGWSGVLSWERDICGLELQFREVPGEGDGVDADNRCLQAAVWGRYSSAHTCYLGWGRNCQ